MESKNRIKIDSILDLYRCIYAPYNVSEEHNIVGMGMHLNHK